MKHEILKDDSSTTLILLRKLNKHIQSLKNNISERDISLSGFK
jgi:hypothetical protein